MRPLPLLYDNQVKLLEMCNILWPEEKIWLDDLNFVVTKEGSIHWYEFVFEILIDHIVIKLGYENYDDYVSLNSYRISTFEEVYDNFVNFIKSK